MQPTPLCSGFTLIVNNAGTSDCTNMLNWMDRWIKMTTENKLCRQEIKKYLVSKHMVAKAHHCFAHVYKHGALDGQMDNGEHRE